MKTKIIFLALLICFSLNAAAQDRGIFLYIPDEEIMSDYLNLTSFLKAWDNDEAEMDDDRLSFFFENFVGIDTLQSLLFESFLRYTKNKNIQRKVLNYINAKKINTSFAESLRKIYAARKVTGKRDGKDVIQYNYKNSEYDENINLFLYDEIGIFNHELGLLLFDNDWSVISLNDSEAKTREDEAFFLIHGGGTNSVTVMFRRHSNVNENEIESKFNLPLYSQRYGGRWVVAPLPLEGILKRAGADSITIAYGLGLDNVVNTIDTGTFNVYLYKKQKKVLYEISYFMNFSPANIHFSERNRMFNLLLFQVLFVFLR